MVEETRILVRIYAYMEFLMGFDVYFFFFWDVELKYLKLRRFEKIRNFKKDNFEVQDSISLNDEDEIEWNANCG